MVVQVQVLLHNLHRRGCWGGRCGRLPVIATVQAGGAQEHNRGRYHRQRASQDGENSSNALTLTSPIRATKNRRAVTAVSGGRVVCLHQAPGADFAVCAQGWRRLLEQSQPETNASVPQVAGIFNGQQY